MTKPHKPEALTEEAAIETYDVLELKFEERFEDDYKIKSQMNVKQRKLSNWSVTINIILS